MWPGAVAYACNPSTLRGRGDFCIFWESRGFTMLARLISNSWPQLIYPSRPPKVLGLWVRAIAPGLGASFIEKTSSVMGLCSSNPCCSRINRILLPSSPLLLSWKCKLVMQSTSYACGSLTSTFYIKISHFKKLFRALFHQPSFLFSCYYCKPINMSKSLLHLQK